VVVIAVLSFIQLYVIPFGWWYSILYCLAFIIYPLAFVLYKLKNAFASSDFKKLSLYIKIAMFMGILSMFFFYFLL
jgi:4-hydroxybenzoate polyprenyltransferase